MFCKLQHCLPSIHWDLWLIIWYVSHNGKHIRLEKKLYHWKKNQISEICKMYLRNNNFRNQFKTFFRFLLLKMKLIHHDWEIDQWFKYLISNVQTFLDFVPTFNHLFNILGRWFKQKTTSRLDAKFDFYKKK